MMRAAEQGAFRLLYLSPERLARADTIGWLRARSAGLLRHRRSPLHLRMGPRIPPRIPPAQLAAPRTFPISPSPPSPPAPPAACGTTSWTSSSFAIRTSTSPASTAPTCATWCEQCDKPRTAAAAGRPARLRGRERHRLRAHHRAGGRDRRLPGRARHRRRSLPRPDGDRHAAAQPGALDERRGARAGGHHRLRPGDQQARRARGDPHRRCPNPSSSITRKRAAPAATACPPIACCCGSPRTSGCWPISSTRLNDPAEKERAWQRYHAVRRFAESGRCRHLQICTHFGQIPKWQRCEMCDVCGNLPEWLDGGRSRRERRRNASAPPAPKPSASSRPSAAPPPKPGARRAPKPQPAPPRRARPRADRLL